MNKKFYKMKKLLILLLLPTIVSAQNSIIKTNLCGLALKNYNLTYERSIARIMSLSVGLRYMPKSTVPLKSTIEKVIDNQDFRINDFKMGNTAITGEARFYLGIKKMSGFYMAPYFRYANFDFTIPIKNPNSTSAESILFNGKISSYSGGLLLGMQYRILKKFVIDIWTIGGQYGSSQGTITATNINPSMEEGSPERNELQKTLDNLNDAGPFKFEGKVTSPTTAEIKSTGPWFGLRSFALSIGYRF